MCEVYTCEKLGLYPVSFKITSHMHNALTIVCKLILLCACPSVCGARGGAAAGSCGSCAVALLLPAVVSGVAVLRVAAPATERVAVCCVLRPGRHRPCCGVAVLRPSQDPKTTVIQAKFNFFSTALNTSLLAASGEAQ